MLNYYSAVMELFVKTVPSPMNKMESFIVALSGVTMDGLTLECRTAMSFAHVAIENGMESYSEQKQ